MDLVAAIEKGLRAALSLIVSLILWYYVPSLLLKVVATPPAIYTQGGLLVFALLIGVLSALGYMFEDEPFGLIFGMGSNLATVVFLFLATNGGMLSFQAEGVSVTANFEPLLFLLILPSVLSIVRKAWAAATRSVGRPTLWIVKG